MKMCLRGWGGRVKCVVVDGGIGRKAGSTARGVVAFFPTGSPPPSRPESANFWVSVLCKRRSSEASVCDN